MSTVETLAALVEVVGEQGTRPVLSARSGRLTAIDLVTEVAALGAALGGPVGVVVCDGLHAAVDLLAAATLGPCLPVNPRLSTVEAGGLLSRVRVAHLLVCDRAPAAVVRSAAAAGMRIHRRPCGPLVRDARPVRADHRRAARPDDVALVLATSGTTARPKLVQLTHRQVLAAARASVRAYRLGGGDTRLNVMPLFHVQGLVGSLVTTLVAGGQFRHLERFTPEDFAAAAGSAGVTWVSAAPAMWRGGLACGLGPGPDLRFVRSGSGPLDATLRETLEAALRVPVVESYGLTEAHQVASTPLPPGMARPGMVGPPTGSAVRLVGPDGRDPPPGELGEIHIRGPNVALGYLDPSGDEQSAFRPDGWFATGDVGWLDRAGHLGVRGRAGDMIDSGGEKIAPQEVEAALADLPGIRAAAAFPVADERLGTVVGLAVVPADGSLPELVELRRRLRDRLAPAKLPRRLVVVESLPRTPSGKVRRQALRREYGGFHDD